MPKGRNSLQNESKTLTKSAHKNTPLSVQQCHASAHVVGEYLQLQCNECQFVDFVLSLSFVNLFFQVLRLYWDL